MVPMGPPNPFAHRRTRGQHEEVSDPSPTFPAAPPEVIDLGGARLVRWRPERAAASVAAINASLDHLSPWMAWAGEPATEAGLATFLAAGEELWEQRKDFGYAIVEAEGEQVLGGCGLHGRLGRTGLEIGYWVHVDHTGQGLATRASRALTDAAFAIDGVEVVRIQCEDVNVRSARVPEKLGYRFQGVSVPEGGPCDGRPTQVWLVDRSAWIAGRATAPS
jgi:RimJ/RimL family protein N-acetyltransferase